MRGIEFSRTVGRTSEICAKTRLRNAATPKGCLTARLYRLTMSYIIYKMMQIDLDTLHV